MTVLTFWRDHERAFIATDTLGTPGNGTTIQLSKLYYMPHSQMVIAARGMLFYSRSFFDGLHLMGADYDAAIGLAQNGLKWADIATADYIRQNAAYGHADPTAQEIAVIGWSVAAGAMRSTVFVRQTMADGFRRYDEPCMIGPWDQGWGTCPITAPNTLELLHTIASLQVERALAAQMPGFGGRLVLCELTRESFKCKTREVRPSAIAEKG